MRRHTLPLLAAGATTLAVATAFFAGSARANGPGLPDTLDVSLVPGNTTELGIEANFGYLDAADGQHFTWICHDVLVPSASSVTPRFYRGPDGSFLATVRSLGIANVPNVSLFYSADGCTWSAVSGIDGVIIQSAAFDPSNPSHVLAVSRTGGATPANNGVYVSNDGGQHWSVGSLSLQERFFQSLLFAPNDGNIAYTSASWYTSGGSAWVYSTSDGGASWAEHPWTFTSPTTGKIQVNVYVQAVSPSNGKILYARTDGADDYLLRSTNGAVSWSLVHTAATDDIRGTAFATDPANAGVWTASANDGTFRATDGVNFQAIGSTVHARGVAADPRGVFTVANNYADGFALGLTNDGGQTFTPMFVFSNIAGVRACPANSDVANVCTPLYPALLAQLGIGSPTPTPTTTPGNGAKGGCSCEIGGGDVPTLASIVAGLLAVASWARRRRSR